MDKEAKRITFNIITKMLFGDDVIEKIGNLELKDLKTGEVGDHDFFGAFTKLLEDCVSVTTNPMVILFPKIAELKWAKANKINTFNSEVIMDALYQYCSSQNDESSLYYQLINSGLADPMQAI